MKPIFIRISVYTMGLFYVIAGANHFFNPEFYLKMMPDYLPFHEFLNQLSGAGEVLLGLGVLFSPTRRWSSLGIIALLIAVFPANVFMLQQSLAGVDVGVSTLALWFRL